MRKESREMSARTLASLLLVILPVVSGFVWAYGGAILIVPLDMFFFRRMGNGLPALAASYLAIYILVVVAFFAGCALVRLRSGHWPWRY